MLTSYSLLSESDHSTNGTLALKGLNSRLYTHPVLRFSSLLPRVRIYPYNFYGLFIPFSPLICTATDLDRRNREPWGRLIFFWKTFLRTRLDQ
ncbi:hypothetical protein Mapa_016079 [Marchantia paleacea]|nr:hypothetical protein Mapa_016079 [Marchantia paleacea]